MLSTTELVGLASSGVFGTLNNDGGFKGLVGTTGSPA